MTNALSETIAAGRFCVAAELVASGTKSEAQVLEVAAALATVPEIGTVSVTNYAGGKAGHDPIRIATGVQAKGLTANVHVEGTKPESLVTVFVPTNHLYLGDIVLVPKDAVVPTGLSIEEGIRIILSAGTAAPSRLPSPGAFGTTGGAK